ncbi:extracellular solute-binding protein [Chelativorans sp. AA-79]|uniref:ABC transporter substrate-binding protein n=1 Tax=Chelativorans sp. AA-79 TaxID=3028735 RepID=UPI0023F63A42|nr:extracellular solute-binding protein [Chelativorans sp. AA-79]WEX11172.1 extracellular solute-binding protein [Chelativorans sp. AA-79]
MLKQTLSLVLMAALSPLAAHAQSENFSEHEQALYEAAKEEGEVIWYTSQFTTEMSEAACELFMKRYEGITCSPVRATGGVTFQRIMQEVQAGAVQGDILSTNDQTDLIELKKLDALEQFVPNGIETMSPVLKGMNDSDGYFFVSSVSPYGITYNTNLVSEEEAPKSWSDLLDPKWKDQVAIAHPGFSGSAGLWTLAMRDLYGWEYFEKLEVGKPQIGRSIADGYNLVVSGERKVAVTAIALSRQGAVDGQPVATVTPSEGLMLPPSGTAILAAAPHPNAAKLFAEFMLTEEYSVWLRDLQRYPLHADVDTAEGIDPLDPDKVLIVPAQEAIEGLAEVQEKFRDTFGI